MTSKKEFNLAEVDVLESRGPTLLLRARGRINVLSANLFEADTLRAAARTESNVVVEASDVTYVSSAGLRAFLRISRTLGRNQRSLHICSLKPHIQQVFVMVGFDRVIPLHPDVESALTAAQRSNGNPSQ
jgi:anti-anti-sigma factor